MSVHAPPPLYTAATGRRWPVVSPAEALPAFVAFVQQHRRALSGDLAVTCEHVGTGHAGSLGRSRRFGPAGAPYHRFGVLSRPRPVPPWAAAPICGTLTLPSGASCLGHRATRDLPRSQPCLDHGAGLSLTSTVRPPLQSASDTLWLHSGRGNVSSLTPDIPRGYDAHPEAHRASVRRAQAPVIISPSTASIRNVQLVPPPPPPPAPFMARRTSTRGSSSLPLGPPLDPA